MIAGKIDVAENLRASLGDEVDINKIIEIAAKCNNYDYVILLIEKGANINSAIMAAAQHAHWSLVRTLLNQSQAEITAETINRVAVMAVMNKNFGYAKELIRTRNACIKDVCIAAARNQYWELVEQLAPDLYFQEIAICAIEQNTHFEYLESYLRQHQEELPIILLVCAQHARWAQITRLLELFDPDSHLIDEPNTFNNIYYQIADGALSTGHISLNTVFEQLKFLSRFKLPVFDSLAKLLNTYPIGRNINEIILITDDTVRKAKAIISLMNTTHISREIALAKFDRDFVGMNYLLINAALNKNNLPIPQQLLTSVAEFLILTSCTNNETAATQLDQQIARYALNARLRFFHNAKVFEGDLKPEIKNIERLVATP